jgi:hypothetical protein
VRSDVLDKLTNGMEAEHVRHSADPRFGHLKFMLKSVQGRTTRSKYGAIIDFRMSRQSHTTETHEPFIIWGE